MPSPQVPNVYPVELEKVDISPYAVGNTDVPYCTTYDSGVAGPHVMVSALVHGNELCGAIALDWLFRSEVRPVVGRLTFAFLNVAAYGAFDPDDPTTSRYLDEDMNRIWDPHVLGDQDRQSLEVRRAREIRPLLDTVDVLFDIHSMQKSAEPLLLCGMAEQGRGLAGAIGMPRLVVADAGHAAGRRMRDYGGFGREDSGKAALLIECGQHWAKSSETVAIQSAVRLLHASGCVPDTFGPGVLGDPVEQVFAEVTEVVTIRGESFSFVEEWTGGEIIPEAGTLLGYDDGEAIRTPYDNCMLVMPTMRTYHGQTAVRLARVYDQGWSGATPSRKLMIAL